MLARGISWKSTIERALRAFLGSVLEQAKANVYSELFLAPGCEGCGREELTMMLLVGAALCLVRLLDSPLFSPSF